MCSCIDLKPMDAFGKEMDTGMEMRRRLVSRWCHAHMNKDDIDGYGDEAVRHEAKSPGQYSVSMKPGRPDR